MTRYGKLVELMAAGARSRSPPVAMRARYAIANFPRRARCSVDWIEGRSCATGACDSRFWANRRRFRRGVAAARPACRWPNQDRRKPVIGVRYQRRWASVRADIGRSCCSFTDITICAMGGGGGGPEEDAARFRRKCQSRIAQRRADRVLGFIETLRGPAKDDVGRAATGSWGSWRPRRGRNEPAGLGLCFRCSRVRSRR